MDESTGAEKMPLTVARATRAVTKSIKGEVTGRAISYLRFLEGCHVKNSHNVPSRKPQVEWGEGWGFYTAEHVKVTLINVGDGLYTA